MPVFLFRAEFLFRAGMVSNGNGFAQRRFLAETAEEQRFLGLVDYER